LAAYRSKSKIGCEGWWAVWSEATEQGMRIGREPDHAASGLLQELIQDWVWRLVGGLERSDRN